MAFLEGDECSRLGVSRSDIGLDLEFGDILGEIFGELLFEIIELQ